MSGAMDIDGPLSSISLSGYQQACSTTRISVAEMECYYHLLEVCQETAALKSTYTSLKSFILVSCHVQGSLKSKVTACDSF